MIMELIDLVGQRNFGGIDFITDTGDGAAVCFMLDGVAYVATEDPDDGYRSMLKDIRITDQVIVNRFGPIVVNAIMGDGVLQLFDVSRHQIVFEVGTDYIDDYYPCFAARFQPQHMTLNQQ
jgi:hypothetical protein